MNIENAESREPVYEEPKPIYQKEWNKIKDFFPSQVLDSYKKYEKGTLQPITSSELESIRNEYLNPKNESPN